MRMNRVCDQKFSTTSSFQSLLSQEVGCIADRNLKLYFKVYCDHLTKYPAQNVHDLTRKLLTPVPGAAAAALGNLCGLVIPICGNLCTSVDNPPLSWRRGVGVYPDASGW